MRFETLIYRREGARALVTLNRPAALNAYDLRMRDELCEVLAAVRDDDEIRVLVLDGAGRGFCAGADVRDFATAPAPAMARRIRFARDFFAQLLDLPVPSLAVLHGFAVAGGLELALCCDLRLAAAETELGLPEVRLGMIPPGGGTQTLPRLSGRSTALDLILTGRRIGAAEALRRGIVARVVPRDALAAQADQMAATLERLDPRAVRALRHAVLSAAGAAA